MCYRRARVSLHKIILSSFRVQKQIKNRNEKKGRERMRIFKLENVLVIQTIFFIMIVIFV